jgi:type VI secretion system protein ImpL
MDDFGRLFGYGGVFDAFFTANLEKLVDTTRASWQWRPGSVGMSSAMLRQFEFAQRVRRMFFQPGSRMPQVRFNVTATDMDTGKFRLDIDGKRFEYKQGPARSFAVTWPGEGPGQVIATFDGGMFGSRATKAFEGPWGWLRLLDFAGAQKETDVRSALRLSFGGHAARIRLEATRIENPFTDRSWQQFRCGF